MDSKDVVRPHDIRWETVKTEEEEYLDKLQSKLTNVMDGFQKPPKDTNDRLHPDELPDMGVAMPHDSDEGLHLLYDYPPSAADGTSSAQPSFPSSSQPLKINVTSDADVSPSRQRVVRFRSRVRITSGVHSISSSYGSLSSSISVPLQGPHGPNVSTSTALLSDMLPSEATNPLLSNLSSSHPDERTPLASASRSGSQRPYTEQSEDEVEEDEDAPLDRLWAAVRKSEEQVMFGKWPWRLLNRRWWLWKFESIMCCCFQSDESLVE